MSNPGPYTVHTPLPSSAGAAQPQLFLTVQAGKREGGSLGAMLVAAPASTAIPAAAEI